MNLRKLFPVVPLLSAAALFATPTTGLSDHKITVYRDRDHDGHFNKQRIEIPHRRYYSYGSPYSYGRPYPYYGYGYGPSVSFSVGRTYSSGYSRESSSSDDLAVDVQRELRHRGYYRGSIDGDVGPGTRNAILNYQSDRGLPVTGRIDRYLLHSLGIG